jgi:hypothetical protein
MAGEKEKTPGVVPFRRTLEAFADTIIPPEDGPGGAAAGAVRLYADPFYRATVALPAVGVHLNVRALIQQGRPFARLPLEGRTRVVLACERSPLLSQAYEGLVMLTKLAFYGAIVNDVGHRYIEFPGPNEGYDDPEGAFEAASDTPDGNFP